MYVMDPAELPGGVHDLGDRRLDAAIAIACDEFHAAQASKGQFTQKTVLECLGIRTAYVPALPGVRRCLRPTLGSRRRI